MNLQEFARLMKPAERATFAERAGISPEYLRRIAAGYDTPSADVRERITQASGGVVQFEESPTS